MSGFMEDEMGRAVARAACAPSAHNTQPWRYAITRGSLNLYTDETRRLRVLDPRGRQLLISCGCALFNAGLRWRRPATTRRSSASQTRRGRICSPG
jgi:hypothetical protein